MPRTISRKGAAPGTGQRAYVLTVNVTCYACRDLLIKNLKRARKALDRQGRGHEYDFFPQTFVLPSEYNLFAEEFRRAPGVHELQATNA